MINNDLLLEYSPQKVYSNFPYTIRYCPYCERQLTVHRALHIRDEMEHYKAVLICLNPKCEAYDEEAREAYVRVYYSSEKAYNILELFMGSDPRKYDGNLKK